MLPTWLPTTRSTAADTYHRLLAAAKARGEQAALEQGKPELAPAALRHAWRKMTRGDLFFLLTVICGRKDIAKSDWLFERCREVQASPNGHLDLWSREHYKSTIITFGMTIQDILTSHGDGPDPKWGGREVTACIFSYTNPIATDFLRQIKRELEDNDKLKTLFPDILFVHPQSQAPQWSIDGGLVVKRKSNPKECTLEAHGLEAQPTGMHYLERIYDDVVTVDTVGTPERIKATTDRWEMSDNLGSEGGIVRTIGTRYHLFDTYRTMMDRAVVQVRQHIACERERNADGSLGDPIFETSVLMSPERLREKRKTQGPYTFGSQMLMDPVADKAQGFKTEWLRYWPCEEFGNLHFYILVDPAGERKGSDWTVMWVLGVGADGNIMVCDGMRDRMNLTQRATSLIYLHRHWSQIGTVQAVGYEQYGMQADIQHIESVMTTQNYRFAITEMGGPMPKPDRIKRLVPWFEQGKIFLPQRGLVRMNYEKQQVDIIRQFVQEEYEAFPVLQHDDGLDALARLEDIGISPYSPPPNAPMADPVWGSDYGGHPSGGHGSPADGINPMTL